MKTKNLAIFNVLGNEGKSLTTWGIANAASYNLGYKVAVIDADYINFKDTVRHAYGLRPNMSKPFDCYTNAEWSELPEAKTASYDLVIFDTCKNPVSELVDVVTDKDEIDLILIPGSTNSKGWNEGLNPSLGLVKDSGIPIHVVVNLNVSEKGYDTLKSRLDGANINIIDSIPSMPGVSLTYEDGNVPQNRREDETDIKQVETVFKALAEDVTTLLGMKPATKATAKA